MCVEGLFQCFLQTGINVLNIRHARIKVNNSLTPTEYVAAIIIQVSFVMFLAFLILSLENYIQNNCYTLLLWRQNAMEKINYFRQGKLTDTRRDFVKTTSFEGIYNNSKKIRCNIREIQSNQEMDRRRTEELERKVHQFVNRKADMVEKMQSIVTEKASLKDELKLLMEKTEELE